MGAKYTTNAATGFNSSPPSDDGAQTAANLITWAKHKTKLADPIKTLAEDINTDLVAAFDYAVRRITTSDSTVAGDHMRTVEIAPNVSTAVVVSLGDATTMTNIYRVYVKNSSTVNQTIGRVTSGDTIDRIAQNITIPAGACFCLTTNNAADGYLVVGAYDESEPDVVNGRLTLTTGVPVTTADVSGATTIYFTPYKGNKVTLFDGTRWRRYTFTEVSIAVPSTSSTVYDLFLYDNSGTLTLDATAWTNGTTRATALTTQNGVYVKTGAVTRRYVGSFRTGGTPGETNDTTTLRTLWNYYNRVRRDGKRSVGGSHTYQSATIRQFNGSATNQIAFVIGVLEDSVIAVFPTSVNVPNTGHAEVGLGLDTTTAFSSQSTYTDGVASPAWIPAVAVYSGMPAVGFHYLSINEQANAAVAANFGNPGSTNDDFIVTLFC